MLIERVPATKDPIPKWLWILGGILFVVIAFAGVSLATHWPFTREAVTRALEAASGRSVQISTFSQMYFPPGCTAEGIRFLRHKHPDAEPLITVEKLLIQGSLIGMFTSPKRLSAVRIVGMHVRIPPRDPDGEGKNAVLLNSGPGGQSLAISKITADNAQLEFLPREPNGKVYCLKIDRLGIRDVGSGAPMSYRVTLTNTEPPGVIRSDGKFGPWRPDDVGATPVSGSYTYDDIDLGHFHGVSGNGQAQGTFSGPLSRIQTRGGVDVDAFQVDGTGHPVRLATTFDAIVNGTNGDVFLNRAVARYRRTAIDVGGWIAGHPGEKGKTVGLDVAVPQGRLEDLLFLFAKSQPGMTGNVILNGKFDWPPGPRKFIEKIRLDLVFGMSGSRFTKPGTEESIDRISESAQGESRKEEDEDPRTALSQIRGHIHLSGGIASISDASFTVPGATATVRGTYRLQDQRVDLHGVLDTKGHLSDTTSGFKALVLKAITPLFKKKHSVRIVPFKIIGAYGDTSVTIDW